MRRLLLSIIPAALLLAACANVATVPVGATRDQVLAQAGRPTRVYPLPDGGQRLQYSLQPEGQYAYDIDLDAGGHVVASRQVLTETNFQRIVPGQWTVENVEQEFGPPAKVDRVASFNGQELTYRWYNGSDMFYFVYVDPEGVVQRAHPGMEFHNAPADARTSLTLMRNPRGRPRRVGSSVSEYCVFAMHTGVLPMPMDSR